MSKEIEKEDKKIVLEAALKAAGSALLHAYIVCGLKEKIEGMLINDDGKEYVITFYPTKEFITLRSLQEENERLDSELRGTLIDLQEQKSNRAYASARITLLEEGMRTIIEVEHGTRKELVSYCKSLLKK